MDGYLIEQLVCANDFYSNPSNLLVVQNLSHSDDESLEFQSVKQHEQA